MGEKHIVWCNETGTNVLAIHDPNDKEFGGWLHLHNLDENDEPDYNKDIADVLQFVTDNTDNELDQYGHIDIGGEG